MKLIVYVLPAMFQGSERTSLGLTNTYLKWGDTLNYNFQQGFGAEINKPYLAQLSHMGGGKWLKENKIKILISIATQNIQ